jgi:hypothetical protein
LREIQVPLRSDSECDVSSTLSNAYDAQTMVCAGETTGGEDTCFGDSGGPLMAPGAGNSLVLVGATSFGFECGYPLSYGVYARLINLRAWADSKLPAAGGGASPTSTPEPIAGPSQPPPGSDPRARKVRIVLPAALGSARHARRSGRVRFTLRASGPVRSVKITLKRRNRLLGRITVNRIVGQRVVVLKISKARVAQGRLRLTVTARDGRNRAVKAANRPRLRR